MSVVASFVNFSSLFLLFLPLFHLHSAIFAEFWLLAATSWFVAFALAIPYMSLARWIGPNCTDAEWTVGVVICYNHLHVWAFVVGLVCHYLAAGRYDYRHHHDHYHHHLFHKSLHFYDYTSRWSSLAKVRQNDDPWKRFSLNWRREIPNCYGISLSAQAFNEWLCNFFIVLHEWGLMCIIILQRWTFLII